MGALEAELGNVEKGRELTRQGLDTLRELGFVLYSQNMELARAQVEFHGGDLAAAARILQTSTDVLGAIGETSSSLMQHGVRALFLAHLGRFEEALEAAEHGERSFAVLGRSCARGARALALSAAGSHDEAVVVGREAVELMRGTATSTESAIALEVLAEVLAIAARTRWRQRHSRRAVALRAQGCSVCAAAHGSPARGGARWPGAHDPRPSGTSLHRRQTPAVR